ncbi:MAG: hypothetical protein ACD_63C00233G0003 [uncultured bacterium]|nr:MAG: hypothetical protein ACD_63C00233G0003 [uncultured bacterium]
MPSKQKLISILLIAIVIVGTFLRFYDLPSLMHFADDEGRDAFIARDIAKGKEFPLLGPSSSTGDFSLGPAFYYMMAFTFLVSNNSEVAPAVMVASFGVLTIILLYKVGEDIFSSKAGLAAAALYSFSYLAVLHNRWSWNPNTLPFFIVVILFCLYKINIKKEYRWKFWDKGGRWLVVLFVCVAVAVQLHASAFILIPSIIFFWIIKRPNVRSPLPWLVGVMLFFAILGPLIAYDLAHDFANLRGMLDVGRGDGNLMSFQKIRVAASESVKFVDVLVFAGLSRILSFLLVVFSGLYLILKIFFKKNREKTKDISIFMLIFVIIAFVSFCLYKGKFFTHYFIGLMPVVLLIIGYSLDFYKKKFRLNAAFSIALIIFLMYLNMNTIIVRFGGLVDGTAAGEFGVPLKDERAVVNYIADQGDDSFSFESVSKDRYDRAFLYLMDSRGLAPAEDADREYLVYRTCEETEFVSDGSFSEKLRFGTLTLLK